MKTVEETSLLLGVSKNRVVQLIKSNHLQAIKFGSNWAIDDRSIQERIDSKPKRGRPPKEKAPTQ